MKKSIYIYILITAIFFALTGCGKKEAAPETGKEEKRKTTVSLSKQSIQEIKLETVQAEIKPLSGFILLPAKVQPNQDNEALIGSLIDGRVKKVYVKLGDHVNVGQLLMTIEGLGIGVLKSDYLKTKAHLDYAKANYERQKKLFDEKIGSQKNLLEMQSEYEKALADFNAEDKKIHSIGLSDNDIINSNNGSDHQSESLPIKSPIAGTVIERNVVTGQHVEPQTNAFRILNSSTVWIDGQLYEKDLAKIKIQAPVEFSTSTYPGKKFTGTVSYVGQIVDEKTRTITVKAVFENSSGALKPQMFGDLRMPVGSDASGIVLPVESVVKEGGSEYVFVQLADTLFEQRQVSARMINESQYEIREGIKAGDKVVVNGNFYLRSEMKKAEFGEE